MSHRRSKTRRKRIKRKNKKGGDIELVETMLESWLKYVIFEKNDTFKIGKVSSISSKYCYLNAMENNQFIKETWDNVYFLIRYDEAKSIVTDIAEDISPVKRAPMVFQNKEYQYCAVSSAVREGERKINHIAYLDNVSTDWLDPPQYIIYQNVEIPLVIQQIRVSDSKLYKKSLKNFDRNKIIKMENKPSNIRVIPEPKPKPKPKQNASRFKKRYQSVLCKAGKDNPYGFSKDTAHRLIVVHQPGFDSLFNKIITKWKIKNPSTLSVVFPLKSYDDYKLHHLQNNDDLNEMIVNDINTLYLFERTDESVFSEVNIYGEITLKWNLFSEIENIFNSIDTYLEELTKQQQMTVDNRILPENIPMVEELAEEFHKNMHALSVYICALNATSSSFISEEFFEKLQDKINEEVPRILSDWTELFSNRYTELNADSTNADNTELKEHADYIQSMTELINKFNHFHLHSNSPQ